VPGEEDVLLRVRYVGLCGSDLATFGGSNPLVDYPRIPGHEVSATIEHVGSRVPSSLRVGMNVTVIPWRACGACSACVLGRPNACRELQVLGVQCDGALTERIVVHHSRIISTTTLSLEALPFVEPLSIGCHAVERGRVAASETVIVLGCGGIGSGVVAAAVARGARVIAVEIADDKLALAHSLGAVAAINATREDVAARVFQLTGGHGADVAIEAVGIPETFRQAIGLVACAGRVVYIGYCKEQVNYETRLFVSKELDILGTRNSLPKDYETACGLLNEGHYSPAAMTTRMFSLAEAADALGFWHSHRSQVRKLLIRVS